MSTFQINVWMLGWLFQSCDLWDVIVGVGHYNMDAKKKLV
jgi:hypothetical protein